LDLDTDATPLFAKSGIHRLRPIQSAALIEAARADGLFAQIPVGEGKTLIALCLPRALDSKKTLLLVKTELRRQLDREIRNFYGKHFDLPLDVITVATYDDLSSKRQAGLLEAEEYDLIVADEGHCLANQSVRGRRFRSFMDESGCRLAVLSGTVTTRSLTKYAPLIEYALRKNSPVPRGYREVRDWAGAIDPKPEYLMRPGVLAQFCHGGEDVRSGYRRRLQDTRGIVLSSESEVGASLIIRKLRPKVPPEVKKARDTLRKTWSIGDQDLTMATQIAAVMRQLASGFYYLWDWPNGEPDHEWLEARRAWYADVRQFLKHPSPGMDSPDLLTDAAKRGDWCPDSWFAWDAVRHRPKPPKKAVWISEYLIDAAAKWARKQKAPAIIWTQHKALGEITAKRLKVPYYGEGTDAGEQWHDLIVAGPSQATGKNLQHHYSANLIMELQPNGSFFEQQVGRTHRQGQEADEVIADWFGHVPELEDAMDQVIEDAEYQETTLGARQKVLYAARIER
jgi:hypothetical protein